MDGNSIRFTFSESVAHFGDYDAATGSVTGGTFDPARIKDAITINVDGRNLNPADYSLQQDGDGVRINLDNQYSRIYKGQTVTLSYDESLIPDADRLVDFSGNLVGTGTDLVTNNSTLTAPDLTPPALEFFLLLGRRSNHLPDLLRAAQRHPRIENAFRLLQRNRCRRCCH